MQNTPKLLIAAIVAGLFTQGTLTLPVDGEYDVADVNFLGVRALDGGARHPEHDLDSYWDGEFSDTKRPSLGTRIGSASLTPGAVPGRVPGRSRRSNAPRQTGQGSGQRASSVLWNTPGFAAAYQAGITACLAAHADPILAKAQERGERNIRAYNEARDRNLPTDDHNYAELFRQHYFRKPVQAKLEVMPEVASWLRANGIDPDAPDVQKVRVFGLPFDADFDDLDNTPSLRGRGSPPSSPLSSSWSSSSSSSLGSEPLDMSIFEAYMSPSGGWMYRTRMLRNEDYDHYYSLSVENRIPMSEMTAQQWKEAAGDRPLRLIVGANIEAEDTLTLLDDLRAAAGADEGVIAPANSARFEQALGVSQGNVVSYMVRDHHSEPFVPGVPTLVAWRHTGKWISLEDPPDDYEFTDSYLLVKLGDGGIDSTD